MADVIDVIVVGGGIAGLSAAYELHRARIPFVLLESRSRVGGLVLSERVDGFTIDAGPDALLVQKPDAVALCEEIGLANRLVPTRPPRVAFIQRGHRLHPLPQASVLGVPSRWGPFVRSRLFSWRGKARMAAELLVPPRRDGADESIGAFMARRFGREAVEYLAEPLLAGIHAGDVDRLSMRALFPRFTDAEQRAGSVLRAFRRPSPTERSGTGPDVEARDGPFRSLTGGLTEMVDALVATLPGPALRLGVPVRRVTSDNGFLVESGVGTIRARAILLATPAFVTAQLVRSVADELAGLCAEIPYTSVATVALAYPRDSVAHPLAGSGFVVPRCEHQGILAATWLSSKWPDRAPDDRVLLRAFVGGARDPERLALSDDELTRMAATVLSPLLGISSSPILSRVYRWDRASPQHEVGHLDRLARIEQLIARVPGLFVTGSGFRGVGIADCVRDGRATAKQVVQWLACSPVTH